MTSPAIGLAIVVCVYGSARLPEVTVRPATVSGAQGAQVVKWRPCFKVFEEPLRMPTPYPIGTPDKPWGEDEKAQWLERQHKQRSYAEDVLARVDPLRAHFDVSQHGELDYPPERFPLFVLKSRDWHDDRPLALVTGGVHGYETSGVHGALQFAEGPEADYAGRVNLMIVPCVSPWGYERIHRWDPYALDPNRNFVANSPAPEAAALTDLVAPLRERFVLHIDLHETTDTDESEFRPAMAARDGAAYEPGTIPDGFYLCGDRERPAPEFQQAVIAAVAKVTHIAPADPDGTIIGSPVVAPGVIEYPLVEWGLCAGVTDARYRTTTEVYPDSAKATPEECNAAQVAAVCGALDYVLAR
jgi:hypothetical protein